MDFISSSKFLLLKKKKSWGKNFETQNSLYNYEKIDLYFDNDAAGNRAIEGIKNEKNEAKDCRVLYLNYQYLNDFLANRKDYQRKRESLVSRWLRRTFFLPWENLE